ncbi:CCA-adding enzyme [Campylobacter majalis]|uniref:CCA-adding enzyme n=1 Tax=Campylobacter majalis TaxID=2790656 RepID=A0ABN7K8Q6_9BACT|nr:CCA tRNA nucleotidyltransferase [Campylobacter majalis]CAD7287678.1 CCA-adding enzyme [Campylobacter majalis]
MLKTDLAILKNKDLDEVREIFAPYTSRVYLVGGCVRDAFLGIKSSDYDIEVYDVDYEKFTNLMSEINATGAGKSYFVYKYKNYDIALPRTETKTGNRHQDFSVSYTNDEQTASKRRDFSMNALMLNIYSGKLLDFWGGLNAIKERKITHIDSQKFCEDSLRVLRGVQFSARFDFDISNSTLKLMQTLSLQNLSQDRIASELIKLFHAKNIEKGVLYLHKLGLIKTLFKAEISYENLDVFLKKLKNARKFIKDKHLFLYLFCNHFKLNFKEISTNLKLPKSYENLANEVYFDTKPNDSELLKIAIKKPLNAWLGLNTSDLISRAKQLGVYDKKFKIQIDMSQIKGLKGKEISDKIKSIQEQKIDEFLANLKPLKVDFS